MQPALTVHLQTVLRNAEDFFLFFHDTQQCFKIVLVLMNRPLGPSKVLDNIQPMGTISGPAKVAAIMITSAYEEPRSDPILIPE